MGHATQKVSAQIIKGTLDALGMSVNDFAVETGQSTSAVHAWIRDGQAPAWVKPACDGLMARSEREAARPEIVLLVKAPAAEKETLLKLLTAVGATYCTV